MEKIPAISVIIPMYNAEKYIGECLDSILAQTFQDFEVIIADNCSTDNSTKVVERYLKKRSQIQLVRTKFHADGAGIPRKTAIGLSRGEYIFFMDSDDAIVEDALEKIYTTALKFKTLFHEKISINNLIPRYPPYPLISKFNYSFF